MRLIGKNIDQNKIKTILQSLEIEIKAESEEGLVLEVPTYRVDVTREADIVEEILRIYGYNNIDTGHHVNSALTYTEKPEKEKLINIISDLLSNNGFNEIMCNSLTKLAYYENNNAFNAENAVQILNPLSADLNCMRQSLLFGGLESISHNVNRQNADLKLYEFGKTYHFNAKSDSEDPLKAYSEEERLAIYISGQKLEANWEAPSKESSFFELKSYADRILQRLGFDLSCFTYDYFSNDVFTEGVSYILNEKNMLKLAF